MGYDVHITRAAHWSDNVASTINADDWLAIVRADPDLEIVPENGPYFAAWSGPCSYPAGGWFDWHSGNVFTKNPDRAIVGKMLLLASRLGATVQGDDGEVYRSADEWPQS